METSAIESVYGRLAGFYDTVYGGILARGRRAAVRALGRGAGQQVLEVGVGTGLSLPDYDGTARVVGIDLCEEMLAHARQRAATLPQVAALHRMDAEHMAFPDEAFDVVVAMYVLSVTPEPTRLLHEMARVCKTGGEVVVVNRFAASQRWLQRLERRMAAVCEGIGFRLGLPWEVLSHGGPTLHLINRQRLPGPTGVHLVRLRKAAAGLDARAVA